MEKKKKIKEIKIFRNGKKKKRVNVVIFFPLKWHYKQLLN